MYTFRSFYVGFLLIAFVIYAEQAPVFFSSPNDDLLVDKRHLNTHARAGIPLFRGSNLSMFVRKRPTNGLGERSFNRRQETRSISSFDDDPFNDFLGNLGHLQQRFDEYSENPGPMFG